MGGHGGLNILPQKSWNVYSARNRARVAADEAQADIDAANARVEAVAEQARQNLQTMRARVAADGDASSSYPPPAEGHINFFADVEAAERHAEERAEARQCGESAREEEPEDAAVERVRRYVGREAALHQQRDNAMHLLSRREPRQLLASRGVELDAREA